MGVVEANLMQTVYQNLGVLTPMELLIVHNTSSNRS